eukprot:m.311155 g.311155  ORF g.311155 m.311155 type:complete len:62 (+) comp20216_c0_seq27:1800-1985(+)
MNLYYIAINNRCCDTCLRFSFSARVLATLRTVQTTQLDLLTKLVPRGFPIATLTIVIWYDR